MGDTPSTVGSDEAGVSDEATALAGVLDALKRPQNWKKT
jgi:hypothetical protein